MRYLAGKSTLRGSCPVPRCDECRYGIRTSSRVSWAAIASRHACGTAPCCSKPTTKYRNTVSPKRHNHDKVNTKRTTNTMQHTAQTSTS